MTDDKGKDVLNELRDFNVRLRKIETYLWPPIDPPDKPKGPTDDPPILGPGEMGKKLQALADRLESLNGRVVLKDELEELREQIAHLSTEITALNESYQLLARYMHVPG